MITEVLKAKYLLIRKAAIKSKIPLSGVRMKGSIKSGRKVIRNTGKV